MIVERDSISHLASIETRAVALYNVLADEQPRRSGGAEFR
jgi:hypothetical protein